MNHIFDLLATNDNELPTIIVTHRYRRDITADALDALHALNDPPFIFTRSSSICITDGTSGEVTLLTNATLSGLMDRSANFKKNIKTQVGVEEVPSRPPNDVVLDILGLRRSPFPVLNSIAYVPVFLPDGSLLAQEGYDEKTGTLMKLNGLQVEKMPMDEAIDLLNELLCDFPFVDGASKAHAFAAILLPFARQMIDGATPLHLIDAPARGTGKGLLSDVISVVATGSNAQVMVVPREEDELEKRLTAMLLGGTGIVLLDNVVYLRQTTLAAVLTATIWRGRRLGKSEMIEVPNQAVWLSTGNNVELSDEIARRTVTIRLDSGQERPEERGGFTHPLPRWALENREKLVSACISIVGAWIDAGRPMSSKTLGRFEAWAGTMGGILDVTGIDGFLGDRDRIQTLADRESEEWQALCEVWYKERCDSIVTAKDIFWLMNRYDLMLGLWANRSELSAQQRIGRELKNKRDRVFGSYKIRYMGQDRKTKNATYMLTVQDQVDTKHPQTPATPNTVMVGNADDETEIAGVVGVEKSPRFPHDIGRRRGKL